MQSGLYVIVGFQEMGQEVASALAHYAHFDNLRRSRVLVLTEPEKAAQHKTKYFCSKYPRFGRDLTCKGLKQIRFCSSFDTWGAEQNDKVLKFATQSQFTRLPAHPHDVEWLQTLSDSILDQKVKPTVVVCLEDEDAAFEWATQFALAWRDFSFRRKLALPTLEIIVWLPTSDHLQSLLGSMNTGPGAVVRLHHFGAANEAVPPDGIRDAITGELVHVVNDSYTLATANDPKPTPSDIQGIYPPELRKMISLSNARSDYFAGHHAVIKYEIATGRRFELSALRN